MKPFSNQTNQRKSGNQKVINNVVKIGNLIQQWLLPLLEKHGHDCTRNITLIRIWLIAQLVITILTTYRKQFKKLNREYPTTTKIDYAKDKSANSISL